MSHIRKSEYLRILRRNNGEYVAYNTLFGNLSYLNESSVQLLSEFDNPRDASSYADLYERYHAILNQFYDMYFLVEGDLDERKLHENDLKLREERLSTGRYIGGVQLSISDTCNFSCKYCFCDFVDKRSEERQSLSENTAKLMTFETAKQTIDSLIANTKRNNRNSLVVKFFGREPLTNWPLMKQIMEHYGKGEEHGIQISYALTTNGSLIKPGMPEILKEYGVYTTVSVDGLADSNDGLRVTKNKHEPTFPMIDKGIRLLAEHGAVQVLSAVMTETNFERFDNRFVDYAAEVGVKEVQILLGMQGDFIQSINPVTAAEKLFSIHQYALLKGVAVTGYWNNALVEVYSTSRLRSSPETKRGVVESCTATGHQISVEPSGDIFPCRAMSSHMGNVSNLDEMLESHEYNHVVMRTYGNVSECRTCPIEGFCQGECLGNLEEKYEDIYRTDQSYCAIYKGIFDRILAAS